MVAKNELSDALLYTVASHALPYHGNGREVLYDGYMFQSASWNWHWNTVFHICLQRRR